MTKQRTRTSLGIFWQGEEVDGFTVHAYWKGHQDAPPSLALGDWAAHTDTKVTRIHGAPWVVWLWDVRVRQWPEPTRWSAHMETLLGELLGHGASVAWCGLEGFLVEPPHLFDPAEMSGSVWAAQTQTHKCYGPPALDEPFHVLTDSQLLELRASL